MLLTRIWGVILACLATAFLAGLFLVASSDDEDFTEADEAAIRAITEAGSAALEAQLVGHPVQQTASVLYHPRVVAALTPADDAVEPGQETLGEIVAELTEGLRVRHADSTLTVALLDGDNHVKAANGAAEPNLAELLESDAFVDIKPDTELLFSIMLGGKLHVAKVSKADDTKHRSVGLGELDTGAGSTFRRVLGSSSPAGLVRKGKLVGAIIGDQPVTADLEALGKAHVSDTPAEGASKAFKVGTGMDARIGALGRIPGPAGRGDDGLLLAVLSGKTAAAGHQDLATAIRRARENNGLTQFNIIMLFGLLAVTAGLAVYLPTLEGTGPLGRLGREFNAMAQGAQHGLFHDRYSGPWGDLARSANAAHEGLRAAYLAELEIEEEEFEANPTAPRARPTGGRLRRPTRAHRKADTGRRTAGRAHAGGKRLRSSKSRNVVESASPPVDRLERPADRPGNLASADTDVANAVVKPDPTPVATPVLTPPSGAGAPVGPPQVTAPTPTAPPAAAAPLAAAPPPASPAPAPAPAPAASASSSANRRPIPEASLALQIDELPGGFGTRPPTATPHGAPPTPPSAPAAASSSPIDDYYREVYEEFMQVKQACGEATTNFTFDKFSKKLAKQTAEIKKKRAGVADVRFTVYVKDGKAALRAKVIKA